MVLHTNSLLGVCGGTNNIGFLTVRDGGIKMLGALAAFYLIVIVFGLWWAAHLWDIAGYPENANKRLWYYGSAIGIALIVLGMAKGFFGSGID